MNIKLFKRNPSPLRRIIARLGVMILLVVFMTGCPEASDLSISVGGTVELTLTGNDSFFVNAKDLANLNTFPADIYLYYIDEGGASVEIETVSVKIQEHKVEQTIAVDDFESLKGKDVYATLKFSGYKSDAFSSIFNYFDNIDENPNKTATTEVIDGIPYKVLVITSNLLTIPNDNTDDTQGDGETQEDTDDETDDDTQTDDETDEGAADVTVTVTSHPQSATYEAQQTAAPLTVSASASDASLQPYLQYAWFRIIGSKHYIIVGAYSNSYTPPTGAPGIYDYYCSVMINGEQVAYSNTARITVKKSLASNSLNLNLPDYINVYLDQPNYSFSVPINQNGFTFDSVIRYNNFLTTGAITKPVTNTDSTHVGISFTATAVGEIMLEIVYSTPDSKSVISIPVNVYPAPPEPTPEPTPTPTPAPEGGVLPDDVIPIPGV